MRVSTPGTYSSVLNSLQRGQLDQQKWGMQIATTKVATDLKGFGVKADYLTAMQSGKSKIDAYVDQNKVLVSKLEMQDTALTKASDVGDAAKKAIEDAMGNENSVLLMTKLDAVVGAISDAMNIRFQGKYLFSGGNSDVAPVTASKMADLADPVAVDDLFTNGSLIDASQVNETSRIETGFLASDVAKPIFEVLKTIQNYAVGLGGSFPAELTEDQKTFLASQRDLLDKAFVGLTEVAAKNGTIQNRVDTAQDVLIESQSSMTAIIGDVKDADIALAQSRLELARLSLDFSAQVFSTLNQSSLLNVLR